MSGNAHQRKIAETATAKVLKKMGIQPAAKSHESDAAGSKLERNSIEAYVFFIVAGCYVVMSAFGVPVNFWAGFGMSVFMAAAAIHLLWGSVWTHIWNRPAKGAGTAIVAFVLLLVVNQGWVQTHKIQNPNAATLSAIQNLSSLVRGITPEVTQSTQIIEVDGKYPDIELGEPKGYTQPGGSPLDNVDAINSGSAPARNQMSTGGLFIAPVGPAHEDAIFRFLYRHEHDQDMNIAHTDIRVNQPFVIPIGGPLRREDGSDVRDADRSDLYNLKQALYIALLVSYQDSHGHIYHKEMCYFADDPTARNRMCTKHNGHG